MNFYLKPFSRYKINYGLDGQGKSLGLSIDSGLQIFDHQNLGRINFFVEKSFT